MQRSCVKCGNVHPNASGGDTEACPRCGAVYAKALPTGARQMRRSAPQSGFDAPPVFAASRSGAAPSEDANMRAAQRADFVLRMRAESLYPTVRELVKWAHRFMMLIALAVAIGGVVGSLRGGAFLLLAGLGGAAFLLIVSLAFREMSLMLADLSDASVWSAAATEDRP